MNRFTHQLFNGRSLYPAAAVIALAAIIASTLVFASAPPASAASPPRIAENGVKIIDAWNMPDAGWQAWLSRPPGDDTYGVGDLFAVGVTFTEPVTVHPNATFKLEVGWRDKTLVYAGQDGNTVWFATTVPNNWYDDDGVRIGDNTETLDHNPTGYFKNAAADTNAVLNHAAPGKFPGHKVTGEFSRPNVTRTEILDPKCDSTYYQGDSVTVKVTFDQNVVVHGTPQAVLKIRGADNQWRVRADYAEGSGTNAILLRYAVKATDAQANGVRMDANALLIQRDRGREPLNRARVVGQRGGLHADLRTDGIARSATSPVDGSRHVFLQCPTRLPAGPATAVWGWSERQPTTTEFATEFHITEDPGVSTVQHHGIHNSVNFNAAHFLLNGSRFIIALTNGASNVRDNNRPTKAAVCLSWDPLPVTDATPASTGWAHSIDRLAGNPHAVYLPLDWTTGAYALVVERVQLPPAEITSRNANAVHYRCSVVVQSVDPTTLRHVNTTHTIGTFHLQPKNNRPVTINPNFPLFGPGIFYGGIEPVRPINLPRFSVVAGRPVMDGLPEPEFATVRYGFLNPEVENGRVTFDAGRGLIALAAGGDTTHEDLDNNGARVTFTSDD